MVNTIEAYREAGKRCGRARREHDEARAKLQSAWFNKAVWLEKPGDRPAATRAFNDAYREEATPEKGGAL